MREVLLTSDESGQLWNVCVWDPDTGTSVLTYKGGTTSRHGLGIVANQYVICASATKPVLQLWSLQKRDQFEKKMICPGRVTALDVTPDGAYCIAAVSEKIHIWQICTGNLLSVLGRHYQNITCLKCTDDGTHFITGGEDNLVIAWSLAKILAECGNYSSQVQPNHVWSNHSLPVTDVHVGFGGMQSRVVSSSLDQTCRLWDLSSGEQLCTFVFDVGIQSVTMDAAEFHLFAGGTNGTIYSVNLYERPVLTERHIQGDSENKSTVSYSGHKKPVSCLCVSLDGNQLISGSHDQTVRIWDVYSGQCIRTLNHKGTVTNAMLISTPPGVIDAELKTTFPIQQFQRHLHSEQAISGSEGQHTDTLNVIIKNEELNSKKPSQDFFSLLDSRMLEDSQQSSSKEDRSAELEEKVSLLQSANKDLYQFAVDSILYNKDCIK